MVEPVYNIAASALKLGPVLARTVGGVVLYSADLQIGTHTVKVGLGIDMPGVQADTDVNSAVSVPGGCQTAAIQ